MKGVVPVGFAWHGYNDRPGRKVLHGVERFCLSERAAHKRKPLLRRQQSKVL